MEPWLYFGEKRKKIQSRTTGLRKIRSGPFFEENQTTSQVFFAIIATKAAAFRTSTLTKVSPKFGDSISSPLEDRHP